MIAHDNQASRERACLAPPGVAPAIRDRIRQLRRVKAGELKPHPCNWRVHPPEQRAAIEALLAEIGYAGALIARELPDGSLQLIDGHLRADVSPQADVPVLVVDLDDREAEKLLALHDPIAAMAQAEQLVLAELSARIETESTALRQLIDSLLTDAAGDEHGSFFPAPHSGALGAAADVACSDSACGEASGTASAARPPSAEIPQWYQLVVECRDLCEQEELFDRLTAEGYTCRVVNTV